MVKRYRTITNYWANIKNYTLTPRPLPLTHRKQLGVYCYAKHLVINMLGIYTDFLKMKATKSEINCYICVFVLFRKKNHFGGKQAIPQKKVFFNANTL